MRRFWLGLLFLPGLLGGERQCGGAIGELLPGFGADLRRAASVFNDVTYGEQPGTEADYRMVADLDDALRRHTAPSAAGASDPVVTDSWAPLR